jgi:hypothetical protein
MANALAAGNRANAPCRAGCRRATRLRTFGCGPERASTADDNLVPLGTAAHWLAGRQNETYAIRRVGACRPVYQRQRARRSAAGKFPRRLVLRRAYQHPAVREAEHDLLMQPHIHFTQSLVIGGAAAPWPLGPSCVSPPPQLNSESSPWLEFARIPGNLLGLSNV